MLGPGADWLEIGAALDVTLPSVEDPSLAVEVVRAAHERCPYSAATRGNIEVALSVSGRELEAAAPA